MRTPPKDGVDWKLALHQLFASEIRKEHLPAALAEQEGALDRLLAAYTHYTPLRFNDVIDRVAAVTSSAEACRERRAIFDSPDQREAIAALEVARFVGSGLLRLPAVRSFVERIDGCRGRCIDAADSFFESPEGQAVADAFRVNRGGDDQEVALVLVPGYAEHTIKYQIFEETVVDANRFHGRPPYRPLLREDGIDLEFEPHVTFYERTTRHSPLDILHPLGAERGKVLGMVCGQGFKLTLIGLGLGLAGALLVTRTLQSSLYGVSATEPLTLAAVALILTAVALTAAYIPARRASHVDPATVLRNE